MRKLLLLAGVCAAGALVLVSAGVAGPPVTQSLTPPPPPYETCKTVGGGTICQGTNVDSYGPVDIGIVCGSGSSAFDIFDSATVEGLARRFYDDDGKLVRRDRHDRVTSGQFSNQLTGEVVPYTQTQTTTDILAVPGDLGSATTTITLEIIFHPAGGAPVLIGAGRTVFGSDGSVEFSAGPTGFLDLIFGNAPALVQLCAALGA